MISIPLCCDTAFLSMHWFLKFKKIPTNALYYKLINFAFFFFLAFSWIDIPSKHNTLLIIPLINATCFDPQGPSSDTKVHYLKHKYSCRRYENCEISQIFTKLYHWRVYILHFSHIFVIYIFSLLFLKLLNLCWTGPYLPEYSVAWRIFGQAWILETDKCLL